MRVAFGLDGVFADVEKALLELSTRMFGIPPVRLSLRQQRMLWRVVHATENFWEHLDECEPGAVAALATIAGERRWEVIFLARRIPTEGASPQVQSQVWLASRGFGLPCVFIVEGPLSTLSSALNLDVVVDSPYEYKLGAASRALPPDGTRALGSGPRRIGSVTTCLQRMCEMEDQGKPWHERLQTKLRVRADAARSRLWIPGPSEVLISPALRRVKS